MGTPEEELNQIEFPKTENPFADEDFNFAIPTEEEEKMLAAVRSDLVKLLTLPVRISWKRFLY